MKALELASSDFRSQISPGQLDALLASRKAKGLPGKRVGLYSLQSRVATATAAKDGVIALQYELRLARGSRYSERVALTKEQGGWRIAGYFFREVESG